MPAHGRSHGSRLGRYEVRHIRLTVRHHHQRPGSRRSGCPVRQITAQRTSSCCDGRTWRRIHASSTDRRPRPIDHRLRRVEVYRDGPSAPDDTRPRVSLTREGASETADPPHDRGSVSATWSASPQDTTQVETALLGRAPSEPMITIIAASPERSRQTSILACFGHRRGRRQSRLSRCTATGCDHRRQPMLSAWYGSSTIGDAVSRAARLRLPDRCASRLPGM